MVRAVGFELTTLWPQTRCATRLRWPRRMKILVRYPALTATAYYFAVIVTN